MKNVLVLVDTPEEITPYARYFDPSELSVHYIVSSEHAATYTGYNNLNSVENYRQTAALEQAAVELAQKVRFDVIHARSEVDVIRASQLREFLGISGQSTVSAVAYRDKLLMKDHLRASLNDLPFDIPKYRSVNSAFDILDFVKEGDYPYILKPISSSGSVGTYVVHSIEDVMDFLKSYTNDDYEIEQFITGKMFHVDILRINNKEVVNVASYYVNDCLSWKENNYLGSVMCQPDDPHGERVKAAARAAIEKLPHLRTSTFHAEFFVTPTDEIFFCEIASRTGGGMIAQAIKAAYAIDIDREWFRSACGLQTQEPKRNIESTFGFVLIPPLRGRLESIPIEPVGSWARPGFNIIEVGKYYEGGEKSGHYLASYIIEGNDSEQVQLRIEQTSDWFKRNCHWL